MIARRYNYVAENHGLIGGAFVSRAEAVRFARDESHAIVGSVVLVTPEIVSSTCSGFSSGAQG